MKQLNDNVNNQTGNGSLNVGCGNFRNANIHIGDNIQESKIITLEQLKIERKIVFDRKLFHRGVLNIFGIVSGLASIVGLYFTLFPLSTLSNASNLLYLFFFLFALAGTSLIVSIKLKRHRFTNIFLQKFYIESSRNDDVYLTKLFATCPWCNSKMNLYNIDNKNRQREDWFICKRNPAQHRIPFDPTVLSEINIE